MQEMNEQLYDIYTQWHVPFWQTNTFLILVCVGAFLIISALLWKFLINRTQQKVAEPYPIAARNALKKLQESDYACPEQASLFYAVLIMILKKYFTEHYGQDFGSKTDQECLKALASIAHHDKEVCSVVEHVLNGSLTIRFAQASIIKQMIHDDLSRAYQVITLTQPHEKSSMS